MRPEAYDMMRDLITRRIEPGSDVLDVGSRDVNGNYRNFILACGATYTGLDIVDGPNVDIVTEDPHRFPFEDEQFDAVISGATMEHVTAIWLWVPELVRVLKPGGLLAILTHTSWPEHKFPVDCWRIMPDGMRYLFDLTGALEDYHIISNQFNIAARAYKTCS